MQARILKTYLQQNAQTVYGKTYAFAAIRTYQDFARQVPIIENYDAIRSYTEGVAAGQLKVLTQAPVLFFEETSGSTAQSKWIPYTALLKEEFQRAVSVWMSDLSQRCPGVFRGRAYWSLSPVLKKGYYTSGGISVGIQDDTAYFNPVVGYLLRQIMAVSSADLLKKTDAQSFYTATLQSLLARTDLSFISVWSPNFFLQLDTFLQTHFDEILSAPKDSFVQMTSKRRDALRYFSKKGFTWQDLFPDLSQVSCWTQAQAALWLPELQNRLGTVSIEGKGLLSTEGVVSIPFGEEEEPILAYTSHFYEFRHSQTGVVCDFSGLTIGQDYEIILTTGGGLYRYATKDLVRVTAKEQELPRLRFLGRQQTVSDMVGEKLHEAQVNTAITEGVKKYALAHKGIFLYAVQQGYKAAYKVLIAYDSEQTAMDFTRDLEQHFCQNPYYRQARDLGQLLPLENVFVPPDFAEKISQSIKQEKQIRDGDFKLPLIFPPMRLFDVLGY